jgi:hypothetical protein
VHIRALRVTLPESFGKHAEAAQDDILMCKTITEGKETKNYTTAPFDKLRELYHSYSHAPFDRLRELL